MDTDEHGFSRMWEKDEYGFPKIEIMLDDRR